MGIEMGLLALTAVTSVGSALGSISQGMGEKTAESNAAIQYDQAAQIAMQQSSEEIAKQDYVAGQTLGRIRATAGAAGVAPSSGSPALDYVQSATEQRINDMYTRYKGRLQSVADLYQGEVARWQGNRAMIGGLIGAGGSLVSGLTKGLGVMQSFGGGAVTSASSTPTGNLLGG